jgi:hypothetical protein
MPLISPYPELSVVRIAVSDAAARSYTGTEGVSRAPALGDKGTIVHVHDVKQPEPAYIVEAVDSDGYTLWLADFTHSELSLDWSPDAPSR